MAESTLLGLQHKYGQLVTEQRNFIEEIGDKVPDADQEAKMQKMDDDLSAYERQIERVKKLEERSREEAVEANKPKQKLEGEALARSALRNYFATNEIGEEFRDVLKPDRESRAQGTGSAASGGVLIPTILLPEIVKSMKAFGGIYDIANKFNTSNGDPLVLPTLDDTANQAIEIAEATAVSAATDLAFDSKTFASFKYTTGAHKINQELIDDAAFNIESEVLQVLSTRLARRWANRFVSGNGSTQPEGIVTALAAIGSGATGATALVSSLTADNLLDLQHSINYAYRQSGNCKYALSDATLAAVRKLKDSNNNYIWQMHDIRTGAPGSIWGSPYQICDDLADIGASATSVLFGDFNYYRIRLIGSPVIKRQNELYSNSDQVGFVMFARMDAKYVLPGTIKRLVHAAS